MEAMGNLQRPYSPPVFQIVCGVISNLSLFEHCPKGAEPNRLGNSLPVARLTPKHLPYIIHISWDSVFTLKRTSLSSSTSISIRPRNVPRKSPFSKYSHLFLLTCEEWRHVFKLLLAGIFSSHQKLRWLRWCNETWKWKRKKRDEIKKFRSD